MSTITRSALRSLLVSLRGARILTVEVESVPRWKGGQKSPMATVKKVSRLNIMVNWSYLNAKAKSEGVDPSEVEVGERVWGKHIRQVGANGQPILTPFVFHGDTFKSIGEKSLLTVAEMEGIPDSEVYVEAKVMKSFGHSYVDLDGTTYIDEEVSAYLPTERERDPNAPRDYKLENIVSLTVSGEKHTVVGSTAAQSKVGEVALTRALLASLSEETENVKA